MSYDKPNKMWRASLRSLFASTALIAISLASLRQNRINQVFAERAEQACKRLALHAELGNIDGQMVASEFHSIWNRKIEFEDLINAGTKSPTFDVRFPAVPQRFANR